MEEQTLTSDRTVLLNHAYRVIARKQFEVSSNCELLLCCFPEKGSNDLYSELKKRCSCFFRIHNRRAIEQKKSFYIKWNESRHLIVRMKSRATCF